MPALVAARHSGRVVERCSSRRELDALVRARWQRARRSTQARARLTQAQELRDARAPAPRSIRSSTPRSAPSGSASTPRRSAFRRRRIPARSTSSRLGVNASYNFDIFGGTRRELEALAADVDYQALRARGRAPHAREQRRRHRDPPGALARADRARPRASSPRSGRQLAIAEERYAAGRRRRWLDVQNQRALVAQTEATLPPLRAQHGAGGPPARGADGRAAGRRPTSPTSRSPTLRLPAELPLAPARPSSSASARTSAPARRCCTRRAPTSAWRPPTCIRKLVISGGFSSSQLNIGDVLGNGINVWNIGINLLQPLFRGGELQARKRAAEAAYEQAMAAYRQSVLQGLQNVADVAAGARGGRPGARGPVGAGARGRTRPTGSRSNGSARAA